MIKLHTIKYSVTKIPIQKTPLIQHFPILKDSKIERLLGLSSSPTIPIIESIGEQIKTKDSKKETNWLDESVEKIIEKCDQDRAQELQKIFQQKDELAQQRVQQQTEESNTQTEESQNPEIKTLKQELQSLKKSSLGYKTDILDLKNQIACLRCSPGYFEMKSMLGFSLYDGKINDLEYRIRYAEEHIKTIEQREKDVVQKIDTILLKEKEIAQRKLKEEYCILYTRYKELYGQNANETFAKYETLNIDELRSLTSKIEEEIQREEMMLSLEKKFTHGAQFYLLQKDTQQQLKIAQSEELLDLTPDDNNSYKAELKRLCEIFIKNSQNIDKSLICFKTVISNFSEESAKSLKEIFDLQNDKVCKVLEKIPKLGLIPKILRVGEQLRLTKCILKDHDNVTDIVLTRGMHPLIITYKQQYDTIQNYVRVNQKYAKLYPEYTNAFLNLIAETKHQRFEIDRKLINSFASIGLNISNILKKITIKNVIDLVRKTVVTFVSLV